MNHAINCEISEKLSANCTCGVDMAVPIAQVPPSIDASGISIATCSQCGQEMRATDSVEYYRNMGDQLADWVNDAGRALRSIMDAYERRIRSLCETGEIEKRPWECQEWLVANEVLKRKPIAVVDIKVSR